MDWSDVEALGNGTYVFNGLDIIDYGARWGYGYIVPIRKLTPEDLSGRVLFEVFVDEHGGRNVSVAKHVDSRADAFEMAKINRQQSVWDLAGDHVLYV